MSHLWISVERAPGVYESFFFDRHAHVSSLRLLFLISNEPRFNQEKLVNIMRSEACMACSTR